MIFIPDFVGKTSAARKVLPEKYSIQDAVHNIGRVAWLVNALNTNSLHNLRFGVRDRLHQPQRGEHVYKHVSPRGCMRLATLVGGGRLLTPKGLP